MPDIQYPFVPKSTAYMREGHFWHIPLSNGRFACGRVLQFDLRYGKRHSRMFLAGLLDWYGKKLPTANSIAGCKLLEQGGVHIRTIACNQSAILGWRSLDDDLLQPFLELSQTPGQGCWLMRGLEYLRPATLQEQKTLYVHSTWGPSVIRLLAERYLVKKSPLMEKLPWQEHVEMQEYLRKA